MVLYKIFVSDHSGGNIWDSAGTKCLTDGNNSNNLTIVYEPTSAVTLKKRSKMTKHPTIQKKSISVNDVTHTTDSLSAINRGCADLSWTNVDFSKEIRVSVIVPVLLAPVVVHNSESGFSQIWRHIMLLVNRVARLKDPKTC